MAKKSTLGIFQGGGVKVTAFAGALKCLSERKYDFKAVAGTSGGAIVAGFIAAGFTAEEIERELKDLDFNQFLKGIETHHNIKNNKWYRKPLNLGNIFKKVRAINQLGMFSSITIQNWINKKLKEKIQSKGTFVTFEELKIPLIVIATDLVNGEHKVWSKYTTPNAPVAKAIRASCTIPLFFQPVIEDTSVFIDGGLISNLPISIALDEVAKDKTLNLDAAIGFHLYTTMQSSVDFPWGMQKYFERLSQAIVNGNVQIQKSIKHEKINLIPIEIAYVNATDFEKMDSDMKVKLFSDGYDQVAKYLDNVAVEPFDNFKENVIFYEAQFFTKLQEIFMRAISDIVIVTENLNWVFELVITIIFVRTKGINIKIIYTSDKHSNRLQFLKALGCQVEVIRVANKQHNYSCVIKDGSDLQHASLVLLNPHYDTDGVYATFYENSYHYEIINRFVKNLNYITHKFSGKVEFTPTIEQVTTADLEKRLRNVKFYMSDAVIIKLAEIEIANTIPHQSHIKTHKLQQVELSRILLEQLKLPYYSIIGVRLQNGKISIIIPPVVEVKSDGKYHVAEGHSRLYYSRDCNEKKVTAIVIENVKDDLPAPPSDWDNLELINRNIPPEQLYKFSKPQLARWIDGKTHDLSDWQ